MSASKTTLTEANNYLVNFLNDSVQNSKSTGIA